LIGPVKSSETIDEFNYKFDKIVQDIPQTHQPTPFTVLMYYINAFQEHFSFFLNEAKPTDLVGVESKAKSLNESWNLSGTPDILNFPWAKGDHKKKSVAPTTEPTLDPLSTLVQEMKKMQATFTQTNNALENMIVHMERIQNQNRCHTRNGYRGPPPNQRPPASLELTNMIENGHPYYCRACKSLHDEKTCVISLEATKPGNQNDEAPLDTCNNVFDRRQSYQLPSENWQQMKDDSIEIEVAVSLFGEMPSPEETNHMYEK
jgi:hypothetical protein